MNLTEFVYEATGDMGFVPMRRELASLAEHPHTRKEAMHDIAEQARDNEAPPRAWGGQSSTQ